MVKEVKIFEARDGKQFKTKQGAENHNKRLAVKEVLEELDMTVEEVEERLKETAKVNVTINALLEHKEWTKWSENLIRQINRDLLFPKKKTIYVTEHRSWGEVKEVIVAEEKAEEFTDENKHNKCEHTGQEYKVDRVVDENDYTRKVYLVDRYTEEEQIKMKLDKGERLTEEEIRNMFHNFPEIYEEEGEEGRWERYMTTVFDVEGVQYAIDWSRGLTEMQENSYYNQPYKVRVEEKEVTITKTVITRI